MIDKLILICIAVFLPMGLVIANRLLDRTASKEKDKTISTLTEKVSELMSSNRNAEAKAKVAEDVASLAHSATESATAEASMKSEASNVTSLDDAIALAQKQIDRNNRR